MGKNAIIRYAVQITCLSDYFLTGAMNRTQEQLSAKDCTKAIRELGAKCLDENFARQKDAKEAWSVYCEGKQGTTNEIIESISDEWDYKTANIEYQTTKYDLIAVDRLRQLYIFNGGNMYQMEQDLGIYRWILVGAMEYQDRIPRVLRNVLTNLEPGEELTWNEIRERMDNIKANNKAK